MSCSFTPQIYNNLSKLKNKLTYLTQKIPTTFTSNRDYKNLWLKAILFDILIFDFYLSQTQRNIFYPFR